MIIYKTTNLINGKIYIGKHNGKNEKYLGSGRNLILAIKKYGKENFIREIIEDNIDNLEILNEREVYWINFYDSRNPNIGYNVSKGGAGDTFPSEESKIKNSISNFGEKNGFFGKHHTEENKKIMSELKKGKPLKEEHKLNIGKAIKGRKDSEETLIKKSNRMIGKNNPMFGKPWSQESKEKVSNFMKSDKNSNFGSKKANASSCYHGVCYYKENKWTSTTTTLPGYNEKQFRIGYFSTEIEAALAYNEIMTEIYGWKIKDKLNVISQEDIDKMWNLEIEDRVNHGNSKLSVEEVIQIKNIILKTDMKDLEIGNLFNVSRRTINQIRNNKTWKNI
jgi:group I intron endonuclease